MRASRLPGRPAPQRTSPAPSADTPSRSPRPQLPSAVNAEMPPVLSIARAPFNWLGVGIIAAILLIGVGIIAAIVLTRTGPVEPVAGEQPSAPAPAIVHKPAPDDGSSSGA